MTSRERFQRTINFEAPDEVLTYEIWNHAGGFERYGGGGSIVQRNASVMRALHIDSTRSLNDPDPAGHWLAKRVGLWHDVLGTVADGWEVGRNGETSWIAKRPFSTLEELRRHLPENPKRGVIADGYVPFLREVREVFGENLVYMGDTNGPLLEAYTYADMQLFMEMTYDAPEVVTYLLDIMTEWARILAELYAESPTSEAFWICDDCAYKGGLMFSREFLRDNVYPRWRYIIEPLKASGIKCFFHSDGNLEAILDDLVYEVGFDGLNPIEPAAGMDIVAVRQRYPRTVLIGNIDCSLLLPYGTPEQIEAEVKHVLRGVGPSGLLLGSSSEIHSAIPLHNAEALYLAAKQWGKYPL